MRRAGCARGFRRLRGRGAGVPRAHRDPGSGEPRPAWRRPRQHPARCLQRVQPRPPLHDRAARGGRPARVACGPRRPGHARTRRPRHPRGHGRVRRDGAGPSGRGQPDRPRRGPRRKLSARCQLVPGLRWARHLRRHDRRPRSPARRHLGTDSSPRPPQTAGTGRPSAGTRCGASWRCSPGRGASRSDCIAAGACEPTSTSR